MSKGIRIRLVYSYMSHYSLHCEPNGYLGLRIPGLQDNDLNVVFQTPHDMRTLYPRGTGDEKGDAVPITRAEIAKRHAFFCEMMAQSGTSAESSAHNALVNAVVMQTARNTVRGTQLSFCAYLYAQTESIPAEHGSKRLVERRTDECVIRAQDLFAGAASARRQRFVCFARDKFSIAIDLDRSALLPDDNAAPSSSTMCPTLRSVLLAVPAQEWERDAKRRTDSIDLLFAYTKSANAYYYDTKYRWMMQSLRGFQNSYVKLPCSTDKWLPGETYLRMYVKFGNARLPRAFFEHHMRLATQRLCEYSGPDAAGGGQLAPACVRAFTNAITSRAEAWQYECAAEFLTEVVSWAVRAGAAYLADSIERCAPETSASTVPRSATTAATGSEAETKETKLVRTATRWRWLRATARQALAQMHQPPGKRSRHVIVPTDQFKGIWDSAFMELIADDCESLFVAIYVVVEQLLLALAVDTAKTSPMCRYLGWVSRYVPVMLTCAIVRDMHDEVEYESDHDDEKTAAGVEKKTRERDSDGSRNAYTGETTDDGPRSPTKYICHVLMLMMPYERLRTLIQRGQDYNRVIADGKTAADENRLASRFENKRATPADSRAWPSFIIDATEYSSCRQSADAQTRMRAAAAKYGHLSGPPRAMVEQPETDRFFEEFHETYDHSDVFMHRNPPSRTTGYNMYVMAVSGNCRQTAESMSVGEFVFADTGRQKRRRGVRFNDLVEGDVDSLQSTIACLPVGKPIGDHAAYDAAIAIATETEPFVALPHCKFTKDLSEDASAVPQMNAEEKGEPGEPEVLAAHLYIRDVDWVVYRESFAKWIDDRRVKTRFVAQKVALFDHCWHWRVMVMTAATAADGGGVVGVVEKS